MIKAVALNLEAVKLGDEDYALKYGRTPPPVPAIFQEWNRYCRYKVLPFAGGQRDQPLRWFETIEILVGYRDAYMSYLNIKSGEHAKWVGNNPDYSDRVQYIKTQLGADNA